MFYLHLGILLSSHSPSVSTQIEPCRVAPYVNLPSMRGTTSINSTSTTSHQYSSSSAVAAAAFSAFDPALLTAAHQVISIDNIIIEIQKIIFLSDFPQYAAAINSNSSLFSMPQYPLNLAALAAVHNKNSSIADLRLKAKKHAEALGLKENAS